MTDSTSPWHRRPPVRVPFHMWVGTALAVLCGLGITGVRGEPLLLDLGTADSPLREGFLRVTPEEVPEPVSWQPAGRIQGAGMPIEREWTFSEGSGRNNPPPVYLTELTCDHLHSDQTAILTLRVPPGDYRVWMLSGPAGGSRAQVWDIDVTHRNTTVSATFPGRYQVRELSLDARADQGGLALTITTQSRWALNALIAAPKADWPATAKDLVAAIRKETFFLPEDVLADWREASPDRPQPETPWPDAAVERGFAVFHRHYLEPVWPHDRPSRHELSAPVRAFAAWDEYEPMTVTIHPLRDWPHPVDVRIGDLVSEAGDRILRRNLDLRYVRYMHVRPNYRTFGTYYRAPDVLMPWTPQPLQQGENLRVWLTAYVGPAVPDGLYRGTLRILHQNREIHSVPMVLRVVPIKLQKDRGLAYGHYYRHPYDHIENAPDAFSRQWWQRKAELEHADMAAHGNTTIVMSLHGRQINNTWALDFDRLGLRIDLYRRHGFHHPIICHFPVGHLYWKYMESSMGSHLRLIRMPPQAFFDEITALVRRIENERRRRAWPELLYYPVDEPSRSPASVDFMVAILRAIKEVPGVRTYVTADPAHEAFAPMKPYVNVWCCQPFSIDRETLIADMSERDVEYWCYPNHVAGENDHTPCAGARMTYGFGFWRSGFRALTPWIYQSIVADQWNYLDGGAMDFFNRTADDASPIPVTLWEAYREGIDDGRYITTLERTIERAKRAGLRDLAGAAEADLRLVWSSIDVQRKYKHDGLWDGETFDVYRWLLASRILQLNEQLKP